MVDQMKSQRTLFCLACLLLTMVLSVWHPCSGEPVKMVDVFPPQPGGCGCPGCCPPFRLPCCDPTCPKCLGGLPPEPEGGCRFGCDGKCPGFCPCDECACCYTSTALALATTTKVCIRVHRDTVTTTSTIVSYINEITTSTSMITVTVTNIYQFTTINTTTRSINSPTLTATATSTITETSLSRFGLTTTTSTFTFVSIEIVSSTLSYTPLVLESVEGFTSTDLLFATFGSSRAVATVGQSSSFWGSTYTRINPFVTRFPSITAPTTIFEPSSVQGGAIFATISQIEPVELSLVVNATISDFRTFSVVYTSQQYSTSLSLTITATQFVEVGTSSSFPVTEFKTVIQKG